MARITNTMLANMKLAGWTDDQIRNYSDKLDRENKLRRSNAAKQAAITRKLITQSLRCTKPAANV